ncbi:MAG: sulfatase-like hydrolase/transferase [Bacteroidota bacterium]
MKGNTLIINRIHTIGVLFLLLSASSCTASQNNQLKHAQPPNFIFYLTDDQDKLDYGTYGNPNVHTPNVDKLASEGIQFNKAFTGQAICAPSRSQLFTGLYPIKNGTFINHVGSKNGLLSITQLLKDAGYEVVLAGKKHVKPKSVYNWDKYFNDQPYEGFEMHNAIPIDSISSYLKTVTKPFCLFIASHYPHGPYPDPEKSSYTHDDIIAHPYKNKKTINLDRMVGYYENIKRDDQMLGWVLDLVDSNSSLDNTLFIYSADHGSSGKFTVRDAGLNVPFIARWPGVIKPDTETSAMIHYTDVLPTFLDLAGSEIPSYLDGKSFKEVLLGKENEHQKYVYGVANHQNQLIPYIFPSRLLRSEQFAYIKNFNSIDNYEENYGDDPNINKFIKRAALKFKAPKEELYDMVKDPYQLHNLAKDPDYAVIKEDLNRKLTLWMIQQDDYLLDHGLPVIYAPNTALDQRKRLNKIPDDLVGILKDTKVIFKTKELDFPLSLSPKVGLEKISFSDRAISVKSGETEKVSIAFAPSDASDKTVYWWSSNPSVAEIDQNGQIMALAKGITEIQAMAFDGHHMASCELEVIE